MKVSEERKELSYLNKGFRTIIENCLPLQYKLYQAMFSYVGLSRTIKVMRDKKTYNRKHYKFYKASKDYDENPEEESIDHKFKSELEENIYKYTFSDSLINRWKTVGPETRRYLSTMKEYMHDLVKLRNNIFKVLQKTEDHFYSSNIYSGYTKEDMKQLLSFWADMKGSEMLTPHNLWGLKIKSEYKPFEEYEDSDFSTIE